MRSSLMGENKVIIVFEDSQQKVGLTREQEKDILSMKTILGNNNLILQADHTLLIKHYVGFIQVNQTRLLIYPKVARNLKTQLSYQRAFQVMIKLLNYSGFLNVKELPMPQQMDTFECDLFELYINIFINQLLKMVSREMNRDYEVFNENQSYIKGKINFQETISKNSYKPHLHYVSISYFTENTLLNRILKTVILQLVKKTKVQNSKMQLQKALLWFEDVATVYLHKGIWESVQFNRLNANYEPIFNMAKLFYYNSSPTMHEGNEKIFNFLVPLNKLFERYIYVVLKNFMPKKYTVKYQGPLHYLGKIEEKECIKLLPDISIYEGNEARYILDAKYKELVGQEDDFKVGRDDIYQMVAYGISYRCEKIILVYPKFLGSEQDNKIDKEVKVKIEDRVVLMSAIRIDLEENEEIIGERLVSLLMKK